MLIKSRFNDVINSSELVDFLILFRSGNILDIRLTHINQIVHN